MIPVRAIPLAFLLAALILTACSGVSSRDRTPSLVTQGPSSNAEGSLIVTRPEGIAQLDLKTGESMILIPAGQANTFFFDPALSPDGSRLAYVKQQPPVIEGSRYDAGSDLWVANRDGSGARVIFQHEVDNQIVRFPQWQNETHVLAVIQEITQANGISNVAYTLQRIEVESGTRERVAVDVLGFTVSPDGARVAYAKLSTQTGQTFEAVNVDGSEPQTLVPFSENLQPFQSPRYSPDGSKIAFAAADQVNATTGDRYVTLLPARPATPRADGLPEDIWIIDADGGRPLRVAELKEDLPALAWNGDGTHIYVVGAYSMYDVNVENGNTTVIGPGVYHSQIVWTP